MAAVYRALCGLFAVADDVFSEPDAFEKAKTSLGRCYREWQLTREVLDPGFDRKKYDQFGSQSQRLSYFQNVLAREEQTSSTPLIWTKGMSRLLKEMNEFNIANRSARDARSE